MTYERWEEVIDDYEKLLETVNDHDETDEGYDVIIYTGQNEDVEEIRAHSIILRTRSTYFRNELSKKNVEKRNGKFVLEMSVPPHFLIIILRFIYCGKVDLTNLQGPEILKLLIILEAFDMQSLFLCIQEHLDKHEDEFLQQNDELLETCNGYDVIINTGRNEGFKAIHAHSFVLRIRSQYFHAKLSRENVRKVNGKFVLKESDISPRHLTIILRYIYCEKIDLTDLQGYDVLKLLIAATKLNIQSLLPRIQEHLTKHQHEYLQQNPIEILENVYQHESFSELLNACLEKICGEPKMLFDYDKFIVLKAPVIELLLKQDNLELDEIEIWDMLIKWGLAQHPNISQNASNWNKEQISIMERTLRRYVPLIRFYDISSSDFFYKVLPYKELLPKRLVNEISEFHMVPDKKSNIYTQLPRSRLIGAKHFALFADWIDKKDKCYNSENIPYKFKLLYRASRDGMGVDVFHNKCDNQGATIVIASIKGTNQVFGGYNPLIWDTNSGFKTTSDSFIYSITNKKDLSTAVIGRVTTYAHAIYGHSTYGPSFGNGLCYSNNYWCHQPNYYPSIALPANFPADDYEVFQVVRK